MNIFERMGNLLNNGKQQFRKRFLWLSFSLSCLAIAAAGQWVTWSLWHDKSASAPDRLLRLQSVSYAPRLLDGEEISLKTIEQDLIKIKNFAKAIRLYDVRGIMAEVPELAAKHNLDVSLGVWVRGFKHDDEWAVKQAANLAERFPNVRRIIVGNETLVFDRESKTELLRLLDLAKKHTSKTVTTAETWNVWLENPELAKKVDELTIHILPYWEGSVAENASSDLKTRVGLINKAYPDKPVWVGELGWPSDGERQGHAVPSQVNQALYLRQVLNWAESNDLSYSVIEAFDQQWKRKHEGVEGASWGILNLHGDYKFEWSGDIHADSGWKTYALSAMSAGFLMGILMIILVRRSRWPAWIFSAFYCQAIALIPILLIDLSSAAYIFPRERWVFWGLTALQAPALLLLFANGFEFAEVRWRKKWREQPVFNNIFFPKVSVHMAIANEPHDMVCASLDRLATLDYPDYEVLVIFNNYKDPNNLQPALEYGNQLGLRCIDAGQISGFKAGALNYALELTHPDAEIIAVVDSDYQVQSSWLSGYVNHFENKNVAAVQSPQAHRNFQPFKFSRWLNHEYNRFFVTGMMHRNQRNAIIQHGTMLLLRRSAIEDVGKWGENFISEDTELGLRLLLKGYELRYLPKVQGRGLVAGDFKSYTKQRFRWAFGAMQILRQYWWELLSSNSNSLTPSQRYHFMAGWTTWFADAIHLAYALASILWTFWLIKEPQNLLLPGIAYILGGTVIFSMLMRMFFGFYLYRYQTKAKISDIIGAGIAGMSLSFTVGSAVWLGLFKKQRPFTVTLKHIEYNSILNKLIDIAPQILISLSLAGLALISIVRSEWAFENGVWVFYLVSLALPYMASILMMTISSARERSV